MFPSNCTGLLKSFGGVVCSFFNLSFRMCFCNAIPPSIIRVQSKTTPITMPIILPVSWEKSYLVVVVAVVVVDFVVAEIVVDVVSAVVGDGRVVVTIVVAE